MTDPSSEREPGHAGRADDATGSDEAGRLRRGVEVEPGRASLCWAVRDSRSTTTSRMVERSITRPSSQTQCPAGLWPPPRTATSSPCVRAKSNATPMSSTPVQRTITAGRWSMSALKQRGLRRTQGPWADDTTGQRSPQLAEISATSRVYAASASGSNSAPCASIAGAALGRSNSPPMAAAAAAKPHRGGRPRGTRR